MGWLECFGLTAFFLVVLSPLFLLLFALATLVVASTVWLFRVGIKEQHPG